ncbi:deoxyguanosinetriphosphate triphosphohydrolase [Rhodospirillales bacterium]|nr:deoxyguanosinetriphosphate triphosphohydrolase [Rhodospirillales bacterium]
MDIIKFSPYASFPHLSRGRLYQEEESPTRTTFQRDRDRIIHSTGFRRLEYKTQVFVNHEGDHYRTRLTHSLEVAQIARSIARSLQLNEDLSEALALAHDLGHTPFGHAGEHALSKMMEDFGGFDHNAQSLAIVTKLERRYPGFEGLNLTWETLEGLVKHNGPLIKDGERGFLPHHIKDFVRNYDLELHTFASAEAQVAALADDIAYNNHDLDDGLRAELFEIKDMSALPLVGRIFSSVEEEYPDIDTSLIIHEAVRRLIGDMVSDCLAETENRLKQSAPKTVTDIRNLNRPVVGFSGEMVDIDRSLKEFLFENMYRHAKVNTMTREASKIVCRLFEEFISDPTKLPKEWQAKSDIKGGEITARAVADYIAGMTDRFAYVEHAKLIKT